MTIKRTRSVSIPLLPVSAMSSYHVVFFGIAIGLFFFKKNLNFDAFSLRFGSSICYQMCCSLRFPGMDAPLVKPKAAAKAASKKAAAKKMASEGGARKVVTKKYTQKYLSDVPLCHMREWLDKMEGVHLNLEATKKFTKQDAITMLSFCLGFHPRDAPVES